MHLHLQRKFQSRQVVIRTKSHRWRSSTSLIDTSCIHNNALHKTLRTRTPRLKKKNVYSYPTNDINLELKPLPHTYLLESRIDMNSNMTLRNHDCKGFSPWFPSNVRSPRVARDHAHMLSVRWNRVMQGDQHERMQRCCHRHNVFLRWNTSNRRSADFRDTIHYISCFVLIGTRMLRRTIILHLVKWIQYVCHLLHTFT